MGMRFGTAAIAAALALSGGSALAEGVCFVKAPGS